MAFPSFDKFLESKKENGPIKSNPTLKYKTFPAAGDVNYDGDLAVMPRKSDPQLSPDFEPMYTPNPLNPYFSEEDAKIIYTADDDDETALSQMFSPGMESDKSCSLGTSPKLFKNVKTKRDSYFGDQKNNMPKMKNEKPMKALGTLGSPNMPISGTGLEKASLTKMEQYHEKVKNMTMKEYAEFHLNEQNVSGVPMVLDLHGKPFTPKPSQAIRYIAHLISHNEGMAAKLVRALKEEDCLDVLVKEIMDHTEGVDHLVKLMGDEECGQGTCDKIAQTMHGHYNKFKEDAGLLESVSDPLDMDEEDDDDDLEDIGNTLKNDKENNEDGDKEEDDDDDKKDDDDVISDEDVEKRDGESELGDEEEKSPREIRNRKKFAHQHITESMSKQPGFSDEMKMMLSR